MVYTNAERQARFRQKLRDQAAKGIRPELVFRAAKLAFDRDPNPAFSWDSLCNLGKRKGGAELWQRYIPDNPLASYRDFGEDAVLMRNVAAVAAIILRPPDEWDMRFLLD